VAVRDDLPRGPDRPANAQAADDVVEPQLQDLHHGIGGVALGFLGHVHVAAELSLHDAIVVAELLLFGEADAIFGIAATAVAVHAGERQLLGGVLLDVGDGNPNATRQTNLRSDVTAHGKDTFYGRRCARSKHARRFEKSRSSYAPSRRPWF